MKRSSNLVLRQLLLCNAFFLLTNFCYAVQLKIVPDPTLKAFCPGEEISYSVINAQGGSLPSCVFSWTIAGGAIVGSTTGQQIKVKWLDNPGQGTLTVTTSGCSPSSDDNSSVSTKYTRMSVFNQNFTTATCNTTVDVPLCGTPEVFICADKMFVQNTGSTGEPAKREVDRYLFSIPAGWRQKTTNILGPTVINSVVNSIILEPTATSGGTVSVRGSVSNSCVNAVSSNAQNITITRSPAVAIVPPPTFVGARCGLIDPVPFTLSPFPQCVSSVSWQRPATWTGSSTTSSITLTPDGANGGTLQATLALTNGHSLVVSLPIGFRKRRIAVEKQMWMDWLPCNKVLN